MSATNITIANAASATVTGHTSNGYRVASTASYSGKTVTGEGQVLSGPPCSISVNANGYYHIGVLLCFSCNAQGSEGYSTYCSANITGNDTLDYAENTATFNSTYSLYVHT